MQQDTRSCTRTKFRKLADYCGNEIVDYKVDKCPGCQGLKFLVFQKLPLFSDIENCQTLSLSIPGSDYTGSIDKTVSGIFILSSLLKSENKEKHVRHGILRNLTPIPKLHFLITTVEIQMVIWVVFGATLLIRKHNGNIAPK